jgi:hypothetical protein
MRLRYVSAIALVTACGGHLRREVVGSGAAAAQVRGTVAAAPAGGIALARGTYDLALRFDVPRAQVIEWTVTCPGVEQHGVVGEPFEAYRERRLAQLRADRERERRNAAAVTSALVGAVAPTVQARGQASGPSGTATVDAQVSGQALGGAAGAAVAASIDDIVELPPGDVGAGRLQTRVHVVTAEDGACTVSAVADDPNVLAAFDVVRIRDLDAEAKAHAVAMQGLALEVRGRLTAQLIAVGADPLARQRRLEAEARARAEAQAKREAEARARAQAQARLEAELRAKREAEARARAEAQARIDAELRAKAEAKLAIELRLHQAALQTRGELVAYLAGECHADPNHRRRVLAEREARLRIEAEARARADAELRLKLQLERKQREARLRVEREQREARLRAERERQLALEAERARRVEAAFAVRADLRAYLVALGARERPPMPPPIAEAPGAAPFAGAVWVAGRWRWTGGQWLWEAGGWRDTTIFGAAGESDAVVTVGGNSSPTHVEPARDTRLDPVRDHRSAPATSGAPSVRDHRGEPATPSAPSVRDHRGEPATSSAPPVRDHRGEPATSSAPPVRDHRKDDKQDDRGPKVRDHRN